MNRLQKKCFIASIGLHLLLALILFVGPAFLSSSSRRQNVPVLTFIPMIAVEANVSSPGNSSPPSPNPAPAAAQVAPVPPAPVPPQPPQDASTAAPVTERRHTVVPSLKPTVRNPNTATSAKPRPTSDTREAEARQRIADQIRQTASGIRGGISSSTSVELKSGGSGGPSYASFEQTLLTIYDQAWIAPEGMDTSEAVAGVRVTVESDGRVSSARIIQRSGDARVDRSVQEALDRVSYIPVPAGTKERRTVEFDFKSRAKQSL